MRLGRRIAADESGVAAIENAFALPILIVMIWMFIQLAMVYRALAGMQQGLGEGARYATLCISPTAAAGCGRPTIANIKQKINDSVYGIGPGMFTVSDPVLGTSGTGKYYDLKVAYSQSTSLLLFSTPDVNVSRTKRVWVAG
jgi:Flp pilus assembly protein TadG